jgi:uncharacterized protein (DUF849 family)
VDSEPFVAAVVSAGAVALAAGDAALRSVPEDLVAACRRHGLPLFEVPVDVSFAALTEQVLAARLRPAGPGPAVARLRALAAGRGGAGAGDDGPGWTVAGIGRALAQARQAGQVAALLGGGVRLVDAAGLGSVELLLATAPAQAREAFRASLLSPLLAYDAVHGTELVRTLRVFLDCSGSWTKASDAMFVHVNSLRYRIRRVGELTGRDLGSLADQAALLFALRLAGLGSAEDEVADPGGVGGVEGGQFPAG